MCVCEREKGIASVCKSYLFMSLERCWYLLKLYLLNRMAVLSHLLATVFRETLLVLVIFVQAVSSTHQTPPNNGSVEEMPTVAEPGLYSSWQ